MIEANSDMSTNDRKRKADIFVGHKIEPNEKKRKLSTDDFYRDPLNCRDIKIIKRGNSRFKGGMRDYYSEMDLTYNNGESIQFRERKDREHGGGGYGLVVHYESVSDRDTVHFSIKYSNDVKEFKTVSKINRMDGGESCGQIKVKSISRPDNPSKNDTLYLFLSKTYDGNLMDFTSNKTLLDKKKVQNIIVQVRDQVICLKKNYGMCYMDIKPQNILYLYPGGNDDKENIEVALGDLGSDGITTFRCVSSKTNTTYRNGTCEDDELLSDCQKYTLSLTYLMLRDGYEDWRGIAMDPNANRNTVRDVQNELRSDVVTGGETMYEILWETKED